MLELKEYRDLVDLREDYRPSQGGVQPPDEEEVTRCIQVMMHRQCIYSHARHYSRVFAILSSAQYQSFFRRYFAAMGYELHHDQRAGMVALKASSGTKRVDGQSAKLKKDETLVLLTLRLAYEEGFRNNDMGGRGEIEITTDDLLEKLDVVASTSVAESRLMEILTFFKRKGILEIGERDPVERVRPLTILPGVEIVVSEAYVGQILEWRGETEGRIEEERGLKPVDEFSADQMQTDAVASQSLDNAAFDEKEFG